MGEKFYGHAFTDAGGTGTTFLCHDPEDCKSRLQEKRREFGAAAPEYSPATKQYKVGDRVMVTLAGQDSPASIIGTKVEGQFIRYVVRTEDGRELTVSLGQLKPSRSSPATIKVGEEELTGASHGQRDLELNASCGGVPCGVIYYALFGDIIWVKYISVEPTYQRKGVGTALVKKMLELNPGKEVHLTSMTPEGVAFFSAIGLYRPETVENNNTTIDDKVKDKQSQTLTEVVHPWKRLTREESSKMRKYSAPRGRLFLPKKDKEGIMSEQPKDMDIRPRTVSSWRRATPEEVEALRARPRHNRLFLPKKKDGTH